MDHVITLTHTHSDLRSVSDGWHLRCTCGWAASAHDQATMLRIAQEHRTIGVPTPVPAAPSPN